MDSSSFEPCVDESKFAMSFEYVVSSPDNSRFAGVFSDEGGEWLFVGSFEDGLYRLSIDLTSSFEYQPLVWISSSEVLYAHCDGLFGVVDVDSGKEEVYGESYGQVEPLGMVDGVLVGLVDTIDGSPRFELVGCVRGEGEVEVLEGLNVSDVFFGLDVFMSGSSVYVEDYRSDAESIVDQGIRRFMIGESGGEISVESEFRSVCDDVSASPIGSLNGFVVVRRGGLESERRFYDEDLEDWEMFLYNWEQDKVIDLPYDGLFGCVLTDDMFVSEFKSDAFDGLSLRRDALLYEVGSDGSVELVDRRDVDSGYSNLWSWVNGGLYGYSSTEQAYVLYCDGSGYPVLDLDEVSLREESVLVEEIDLDIEEDYSARVHALDEGGDDVSIEDRPAVICPYPSGADISIRDSFGVELLERGFLVVVPVYSDGDYFGKTLAMAELVRELDDREYCGDVGLYGSSAGGTQILNFAASSYSELVDCVFALCPDLCVGGSTGTDVYLSPVERVEEAPLLFKDYSPLYKADRIDVPTSIVLAENDTRVSVTDGSEMRQRSGDDVSVEEYDIPHQAVRFDDQMMVLSDIVGFFEDNLM